METQYRNAGYFFLILVAFVAAGFYKPYFALFPRVDPSFNSLVHIHATALMLWVVLLVVQPLLVRYRKRKVHRSLGKFTYFLVPVIVLSSIGMMIKQYDEGLAQKMSVIEGLKSLFVSFGELLLFAIFYALAVLYRRNAARHARYIISTALVLITPSLGRVAGYWFAVTEYPAFLGTFLLIDLIVIALIVFDRRHDDQRASNYRPYATVLALFLLFHVGWLALGHPT